jgi:thiol:disulfide interchange protein DsbD
MIGGLVLVANARAQNRPSIVRARVLLERPAVRPGGSIKVTVMAAIEPGYHLNAHKPTLDYLIPTELKLDAAKDIAVETVSYPRGTLRKFTFSDTPLSVYEGNVAVSAVLRVASNARPGSYRLTGKLLYQACNNQACLAPTSVPLSFTIEVSPATLGHSDASH